MVFMEDSNDVLIHQRDIFISLPLIAPPPAVHLRVLAVVL